MALFVNFTVVPCIAVAQETDTIGKGGRDVHYFSIYQGSITMTPSTVSGVYWNGSSWVSTTTYGAHSYATYEIGMWKSGENPTKTPSGVTTINGGTVNIVDQTDVSTVLSNWDTKAAAVGRYSTSNTLSICCNVQYQVQLNNVWMTANNCIQVQPHKDGATFEIYLKGDNRVHNIFYYSHTKKLDNDPSDFVSENVDNVRIQFYDQDKNTGTSKKGTLTLGGTTDIGNHYNSVIGGTDTYDYSKGIEIYGGTIFAGAKFSDNCTAIGGGGNGYGGVTINGGTVTAVCSSTGCAIGGGIGWSSAGGEGDVTITGGTVYAYNHGYGEGTGVYKFVPATAIGGASSGQSAGNTGIVNISGGTVYAQSTGGTAIGGGGSAGSSGGAANVTISGSANVTAKSVSGTVNNQSVAAGTSIGGGTGSTAGGNVTFKMTGGTLKTGSVGGGKKTSASNEYGSGTVTIEGGTINGQFVLSPPSSGHSEFTMKGGTIGGKLSGFTYMQPDGYAVWMNDSGGSVTINQSVGTSTISGCTGAVNGGAIYMLAGTFTLTAGTIEKCSATNGGAVYMGGGTFNMNGGTIGGISDTYANSATGQGGGIYMGGGTFTMKDGTISYNKTQKNENNSHGGGVYIASGGTVTINGGTISNNTANYGGGFYVNPGASATTIINNLSANTTISGNKARYGAGAFIETGSISVSSTNSRTTKIENNIADYSGGGLYVKGSASLTGVLLNNNQANGTDAENRGGGGMFVTGNHDNSISGGEVNNNTAENKGGGVYVNAGANYTLEISGTAKMNSNQANYGGGAYIAAGKLKVTGTNASNVVQIMSNTATTDGGGVYAAAGSVTASNASINSNTATNGNGGGIYAVGAVTVTGGTVSGNHADKNATDCGQGGGIYALAGSNTITVQTSATVGSNTAKQGAGIYAASGSVEVNSSTLSGNVASSDGGGVYAAGGSVTMTTATLSSNSATSGNGGGIYGGGGNITVNAGSIATNTANSGNGGGVYATGGGTINFNAYSKANPSFTGNTAINGGVLYMEGGTCNINAGTLGGSHANRNKATTSGGAIYVNEGTVNFATGEISFNTAGTLGGGIFVADNGTDYGTLNMTGDVTLSKNHVPAGKHGGGVYLAGVISIGSSTARTVLAQDNFASGTVDTDPGSVTIDATNRNNVYLPIPVVNTNHKDVITVVKNGLTTSTRVGFSVPHNFVPVIYCNEAAPYTYLRSFLENPDSKAGGMWGTVFDDAKKYTTVHYPNNSFYDPQHIYLSGGTWVDHVSSYTIANPPAGFSVSGDNVTISSNEALAWLIKYINGISPYTSAKPGVNVTLASNVDMGDYAWVPIASAGATQYSGDVVFTGTFNGNGHIISNLNCQYLGQQTGTSLGLFGTVGTNARVENVQLKDALVNTADMSAGTAWLGGIAGQTTGGVIESCVVDAEMETLNAGAVMGGVVGNNGATVHSCFATADMTGYQMGGLVGANSGDLYNSYAYTKFDHKGGSTYFGGLVGVNTGRVENCYVRLQGSAPSGNFGWLVGNNTGGTINYSYSPNATYTVSGQGGTQNGLSTFGVTAANAYDYRVRDNQVAAINDYAPTYDEHHLADYQLKKYLNKWVEQDAAHKATYAGWTRPTTQAINDDYPLLKLHGFNAVAATSGEISLDYGDINTLLTDYATADNCILFYGSKEGMNSNSGSAAPLYIDEDAVLTPSTEGGDIVAHVGVTIDNSACHAGANPSFGGSDNIDWHFFSSVLKNSQIGLHYGDPDSPTEDNNPYNAYEYPDWHATFTNANGYFPINLNNYYAEWDLYAYCEPDYHWINLKRNSASHWHEDWPGINIPYTNDTEFGLGKGYMVALKEEGYLHAYGTLNTHPDSEPPLEVDIDYTPGISWTTREGQNLLGNPYQSYLDFNAFVGANRDLWGSDTTPFYIVMDEGQADYVIYAYTASYNAEAQASRYIHPHQGFMIKAETSGRKAKFHDGMRTTTMESDWSSDFRDGGSQPNYALVNLFVKDKSGNRDIVTVELGRPEKGGVPKSKVPATSTGRVSCHYEGESYALVFTEPGLDAANIRFVADEDGEYTMTWNTQNGEFSYLHLIDNMTGADIDCLSTSEYKFSARESDYNSRFRLVFDYTGIEENEDGPSTGSGAETFAYYANGEIHLTDADDDASLQIIDMTGRVIVSRDGVHTVSTTGLAAGVYVLRLTTANGTRTQKIILN